MKSAPGLSLLLITLVAAAASSRAEVPSTWTSWRGPAGTGAAPSAKPPLTWSDTQNIKWKTKLPGEGYSTPIIWKDRIFLLAAVQTSEGGSAPAAQPARSESPGDRPPPPKGGKRGGPRGGGGPGGPGGFGGGPKPTTAYEFTVLALDRSTGKILWQKVARKEVPHDGHHPTSAFATASPTTDGENLYVPFGSRGFYCFDLQGNLKWEKDLGDMQIKMSFGEGASPALAGNLLIISWDHEAGSFITALDKKTGAEVWRTKRDEGTAWSTPLIVEHEGRTQAIVPASKMTRSYDVKTGELMWEASGLTGNVIPSAMSGHGLAYVTSGFRGFSMQAIKLSARGDVSASKDIVWSVNKSTPYVPSPVLSGDRIYVIKSNDAYLSCLNALTGEFNYQDQRLTGLRTIYSSPLAANGHVYITDREGTTVVVKDGAQFEIVGTNKLGDGVDASPVALDNQLFLRGHQFLYCISES